MKPQRVKQALEASDAIPDYILKQGEAEQKLLDDIATTVSHLNHARELVRECEIKRADLFLEAREKYGITFSELARFGGVKPDRVSEIVKSRSFDLRVAASKPAAKPDLQSQLEEYHRNRLTNGD